MSKFNVGDVVRCTYSEGFGDITITRINMSVYGVGDPIYHGHGTLCYTVDQGEEGAWRASDLELVATSELAQLRKFKEDAIAKYPNLAPMSEEDQVALASYNDMFDTAYTHVDECTVTSIDIIKKAIQWGRAHATS